MNAAFTICANNYLASAKVLKDSFSTYHPEIPFFIVLVDKEDPSLNYTDFCKDNILYINDIAGLDIDDLSKRFNIAELCTTVKPFIFKYLFKKYTQVVYLDPDIKVYSPLTECWEALKKYTFVLTPHLMTPIDDDKKPTDFITLRTGIFNLGFIGLSSGGEMDGFLDWWGERVLKYGYTNWNEGMFYDQIWANYIPVMFNNYYILKHFGYNVANWNWHERFIEKINESLIVNDKYPLVFFHFSSYKYSSPEILCQYNTRYSRDNRADLIPIFDDYYNDLTKAGARITNNLKAYYQERYLEYKWQRSAPDRTIAKKIKRRIIKFLDAII